jgi:hypothetical protein
MDSPVTSILDAKNLPPAAEIRRDLDRAGIPAHLHGGLIRYVVDRIAPGHFLTALLENDLVGVINRGDTSEVENTALIKAWVSVLYNCEAIPAISWGSKERVDAWLSGKYEFL